MAITMRINKDHDGIELLFPDSERPNAAVRTALKEQGFRWHHTGKYWFARQTPERLKFAGQLTGEPVKAVPEEKPSEKAAEPRKGRQATSKPAKAENTFAAVYDKIGSCEIRTGSDLELHEVPSQGVYCKDIQAFIRHYLGGYDDSFTIVDLTNAGKTGKECAVWRIYRQGLSDNTNVSTRLAEEEKILSCAELVQALREGRDLESIKLSVSQSKGIDTFSPFVEVKPLTKMPEEWNKRNFTTALLSGQIYMGQVDYRYTDDYAYDYAVGYSEGVGIDMPSFVREAVEGWSSGTWLRMGEADKLNHTCPISFSEHSNCSKTLYFDLSCDIREGKRRAEEKAAGIQAYNAMMKASCLTISPESLDPNKIYSVTSLAESSNTGICGTKTELLQGSYLQEMLSEDWSRLEILSCETQQIVPDKLYDIFNFYNRNSVADDRVIDFGNSHMCVTGKALLELTAEGICLPYIQEGSGEYGSIESAREMLNKFIRGTYSMMFTGLSGTGYEENLIRLNREAKRAGHAEQGPAQKTPLGAQIAGAAGKGSQPDTPGQQTGQKFSR